MGRIKRILEQRGVSEPILNRRLTVELCENVHLHYRNFRLEFPKEEFLRLVRHMKTLDETKIAEFDYGHNKFELLLEDQELPPETEWNHRLQIEEQVEGHFHVHFRNLRVELRDLADFGVRPPLRAAAYYLIVKPRKFLGKVKTKLRRVVGGRKASWLRRFQPWSWRGHKGFGVVGIDSAFYARYLWKNPAIKTIHAKNVRLSELRAHIRTEDRDTFIPISATPAAKYLVGDKPGYQAYHKLENSFDVHDQKSFDKLIESVKNRGYDFGKSAIIIFNGEPIVRDGQHRAAILYHLHGDIEIVVADVEFTDYAAYYSAVGGSVLKQPQDPCGEILKASAVPDTKIAANGRDRKASVPTAVETR